MSWEIIKRDCPKKDETLWQSKDAEGRQIYQVTTNFKGAPEEPTGNQYFYTKVEAMAHSL